MGKTIGIDLGTTNSVMAILRGDRVETIENLDGKRLTPSVVGLNEADFLVGDSAKAQAMLHPEDTIFSVKRFMGRNFRDKDIQEDIRSVPYKVTEAANGEVEVWLGKRPYSPPEVSSIILKAMKEQAEEQFDEEVTHAVITVPAYFGQRQRDATRTAGKLAGLEVMRVLPEPTAAALAYGMRSPSADPKSLLVYDLGGGTFDVTVLVVAGGMFTDVTKTGDNHLGGDDFDQAIMNHVVEHTKSRFGVNLKEHPEAKQKLKVAAEEAKIKLTKQKSASIVIPAITRAGGRFIDVQLDLTRHEYDRMIHPRVKRTIALVHEAIRTAEYRPEDIDHILLAGGSTQTPLVIEMLRQEFGEKILRNVNPMECVAHGAAVQTGIPPAPDTHNDSQIASKPSGRHTYPGANIATSPKQPTKECPNCNRSIPITQQTCMYCDYVIPELPVGGTIESTPMPLGIQTVGDKMEVIVAKGTLYPTKEPFTQVFQTAYPGQTLLMIPVYEGFAEIASDNEYLGVAEGELPAGLPNATDVAISFSLDADGIIYVTALLPDRPGVKINAKIDWKHREQSPSMPGGNKPAPARPTGWQEEAQMTLAFAGLILAKGERYLDWKVKNRLQTVGTELQQALNMENEPLARRKKAELEQAVNGLGPVLLLSFAAVMAEADTVSPVEARRLNSLLQQADQAAQYGNTNQLNNVLNELDKEVQAIMGRLQAEGGEISGLGLMSRGLVQKK